MQQTSGVSFLLLLFCFLVVSIASYWYCILRHELRVFYLISPVSHPAVILRGNMKAKSKINKNKHGHAQTDSYVNHSNADQIRCVLRSAKLSPNYGDKTEAYLGRQERNSSHETRQPLTFRSCLSFIYTIRVTKTTLDCCWYKNACRSGLELVEKY